MGVKKRKQVGKGEVPDPDSERCSSLISVALCCEGRHAKILHRDELYKGTETAI